MSEGIPWTWTEYGEDSREQREARRNLHEHREAQLYTQEIDQRLVGFVWVCPSGLADALVVADLADVGWLDEIAIERPGVVPICNLEFMERGVGARNGRLVELSEDPYEEEVDLSWVWEQVFGPGLDGLRAAMDAGEARPAELFDEAGALKEDGLFREMAELGGVALVDFAAAKLGLAPDAEALVAEVERERKAREEAERAAEAAEGGP